MNTTTTKYIGLILVTGATGDQGGATVRHLLKNGHHVRAMTRNPDQPSNLTPLISQYPGKLEIVRGDYDDPSSVEAALVGVKGVFSIQLMNFEDEDIEARQGTLLIDLAKKAGVKVFVYSSVAKAGEHESFPRWNEGAWNRPYWLGKWKIEEAVKKAGFDYYTILKPAGLMDNFKPPKVHWIFPTLLKGEIATVMKPETKLDLFSAENIGAFACAVFENPEAFNKHSIPLASESLTMQEIADILSKFLNVKVKVTHLTLEEALAQGQHLGAIQSQDWNNVVGYGVDIGALKKYNIPLISLEEWAKQNLVQS